jgi:hypothetical protein
LPKTEKCRPAKGGIFILSINSLGPQLPEGLCGLGGMYAESAKTLAKQGFPYNGGWSRHTRMLHECGGNFTSSITDARGKPAEYSMPKLF